MAGRATVSLNCLSVTPKPLIWERVYLCVKSGHEGQCRTRPERTRQPWQEYTSQAARSRLLERGHFHGFTTPTSALLPTIFPSSQ